jgi:hypothetical protein
MLTTYSTAFGDDSIIPTGFVYILTLDPYLLTPLTPYLLILTLIFSSAPVPSASLVIMLTTYSTAFGDDAIPTGFAYIVAIDWLMDRFRTMINVTGDTNIYLFIFIYIYMHIYIFLSVYIYVYTYKYLFISHQSRFLYCHHCNYIYIFIYIHVYIYIYIHTFIYMYITPFQVVCLIVRSFIAVYF